MKTNFKAAKKFIEMKKQEKSESLSGPGSHLINAADTVVFLSEIIKKHKIQTILDLGCGDWNWMKKIHFDNIKYEGWDCDEEMINENIKNYSNDLITFKVQDIVTTEIPRVDLIICRDVLFHMDKEIGLDLVKKIKKSCNYFLSTSFLNNTKNKNIVKYTNFDDWGFYEINLNIEPFSLQNFELENRKETKIPNRYVVLYNFGKN